MAGYGWDEYDARRGGVQTVHDAGNMIDITTSFVKIPGVTGSAGGGSWGARIKGTPRADAPADGLKTTVLLYLSQEGYDRSGGDVLGVEDTLEDGGDLSLGFDGNVRLAGKSDALGGEYRLVVTRGTGDHPTSNHELSQRRDLSRTVVQTLAAPDEIVWQAKGVVFRQLKDGIDSVANEFEPERAPPPWQVFMLENKPGVGNVHVVQKVFEGPFEFDVLFSSLAAAGAKELTSDDVTREIKANSEAFAAAFDSVFSPRAPFNKGDKAAEYARFGRSMLSNLVGGIGYFYGEQLVDRSGAPEYDEENEGFWEETAAARARHAEQLEGPYELFTAVPSRPFFPRGFLWDEGFHLLPVADWDMDLALDVVRSWYGLMDDDGWIAREQILGPEARSKVPAEFQVQYPHYANPPTLFFIVDIFAERLARAANGTMAAAKEATLRHDAPVASAHLENPELGLDFLRKLYPLLRRQFYWFKRTQYGDIRSYDRRAFSPREAYRWRGRTETHILTSGLDDYPRPQPPHPGELHVDLMSWVGMMARSLAGLADMLGRTEDAEEYRVVLQDIERNLDDLHWSEKEGCYCDATIDEFEEHALVCHKGYVSLFPFLLGLMRHDSPKLGRILQLLADPDELWSDHGIRSLSAKDPLYRTNENYWRSPVWININYLAIAQLHVSVF